MPIPTSLKQNAESTLDFAAQQVRNLITNHPDYFPLYTEEGKWLHGKEAWTNWCEGFLVGMIWVFAQRATDPEEKVWWRERAEHYSRRLEERQWDCNVHDLGFVFWSSWKRWNDLTGDEELNKVIIQAGKAMGLRFNEKGYSTWRRANSSARRC